MKRRLIYLPVEAYRSRYTEYLSCPGGVFEACCKKLGVPVHTIRPYSSVMQIKIGQVIDPLTRAQWSFHQIYELMGMMKHRQVSDGDVIYIEDFWIGGMEMIPYMQDLVRPFDWLPVWAFCHAQSVDPNDFTAPMARWMRKFEQAWASVLAGIFVAAPELKNMLRQGSVFGSILATGTVWSSDWMTQRYMSAPAVKKEKLVVFSSRWDSEKDPEFFCSLVKAVLKEREDIRFVVCTGNENLTSNRADLIGLVREMVNDHSKYFKVEAGLSKQKYFDILRRASVQFNCAKQDFVSYTLLEACLAGCSPLYPSYLTFPDALEHHMECLYTPSSIQQAKDKLYNLIDNQLADYSWVCKKYDSSVHRMLHAMGFPVPEVTSLEKVLKQGKDRTLTGGANAS